MIKKSGLLFIICAFFLSACSGGGGGDSSTGAGLPLEMGAKKIGQKAKALSKANKHLEAAKLYDELVEKYSETKYFAELKQELFNKGISIEKTLSSVTSKRMFKFQNMLVRYKKKHGDYPRSGEIQAPKDVWGMALMQKVYDGDDNKYEFLVVSRGADHKAGSDDDIVMVRTKDFTTHGNKFGDVATDKEKEVARSSRKKRRKGTVSISDLKAESLKGRRGGSAVMSLEELSGQTKKKKKKKRTRPKSQVKSLDELMGE